MIIKRTGHRAQGDGDGGTTCRHVPKRSHSLEEGSGLLWNMAAHGFIDGADKGAPREDSKQGTAPHLCSRKEPGAHNKWGAKAWAMRLL